MKCIVYSLPDGYYPVGRDSQARSSLRDLGAGKRTSLEAAVIIQYDKSYSACSYNRNCLVKSSKIMHRI